MRLVTIAFCSVSFNLAKVEISYFWSIAGGLTVPVDSVRKEAHPVCNMRQADCSARLSPRLRRPTHRHKQTAALRERGQSQRLVEDSQRVRLHWRSRRLRRLAGEAQRGLTGVLVSEELNTCATQPRETVKVVHEDLETLELKKCF